MAGGGHGLDKGKDKKRVLPDYDELKRLILDEGWTYREVAEKYGVRRDAVFQTFKARTIRHGDPWPLELTREDRGARSQRSMSIEGVLDVEAVIKLRNRLRLRLELNNEGFYPFGLRHQLDKNKLGQLLRGEATQLRVAWASKLVAALNEESGF